jgi:hypothetical protein
MAKFQHKPTIPHITASLPKFAYTGFDTPSNPPSSPEEFIHAAAVSTRQSEVQEEPALPWLAPAIQQAQPRTHTFRLPEELACKLQFLSEQTRISKTKLLIEAVEMLVEKHFSTLGIPK